jgi:hypothetical protein
MSTVDGLSAMRDQTAAVGRPGESGSLGPAATLATVPPRVDANDKGD